MGFIGSAYTALPRAAAARGTGGAPWPAPRRRAPAGGATHPGPPGCAAGAAPPPRRPAPRAAAALPASRDQQRMPATSESRQNWAILGPRGQNWVTSESSHVRIGLARIRWHQAAPWPPFQRICKPSLFEFNGLLIRNEQYRSGPARNGRSPSSSHTLQRPPLGPAR